mmetsp:Transcript_4845/g.14367  ORF Transcript_4845/g.14367 Transcript_4845/m.14367 type:complete len:310 (+) Transcript_4845:473-1402(+)
MAASSTKAPTPTGHKVTTTVGSDAASAPPPLPRPETLTLNDGRAVPQFGLGVWQASGGAAYPAVLHALRCGYRHIDTAEIYRNEDDVGRGIAEFLREQSAVKREDLFITTKFFPQSGRGAEAVEQALAGSLKKLGLTYVDLYLIHSPNTKNLRLEQWSAMEDLHTKGSAKSIGVSNYGRHHIEELLGRCRRPPAVNQIEVNPFIVRADLCAFCKSKGITVTAYSPLARAQRFGDPRLAQIAASYGLTPAQCMVRWCLQKGYIVIPKSVTPARIEANAALGDRAISDADMASLDALDEYFVTGWDPTKSP